MRLPHLRVATFLVRERRALALLTAIALIGEGLQTSGGTYDPAALVLIGVGAVVAAVALLLGDMPRLNRAAVSIFLPVFVLELVQTTWEDSSRATGVVVLAVPLLIAAATIMWGRRALAAAAGVLGAGMILALILLNIVPNWGNVGIDLFAMQQRAGSLLLAGHNPYQAQYILYIPVDRSSVLGSAHFAYGPTVAVADALVRFTGDIRVADIIGWVVIIGGITLAAGRSEPASRRAALAMALTAPVTMYMVRHAWVDSLMLAGFVSWVCLRRSGHPRWGAVALAVAICAKPTILVALIPFVAWSARGRREVALSAVVSVLFFLPFTVGVGVGGLWDAIVGVEVRLPVRLDALTVNAWLLNNGHGPLPLWLSLVALIPAVALLLRRRPHSDSDLLVAGAFLLASAYLVAKFAFYDYYVDVVVLLLLGLTSGGALAAGETPTLPAPIELVAGGLLRRPRRGDSARPVPTA